MNSKSNPRKDFTQIAFDVVRKATGEYVSEEPKNEKNKAAVELGRLGGKKGVYTTKKPEGSDVNLQETDFSDLL